MTKKQNRFTVLFSGNEKRGEFLRFCINGCLAVAIQYVVYWLLLQLMGADVSKSNAVV